MQISSRFSIAVHILTAMEYFKDENVTSEFLAKSIQINPVVVRRIVQLLKKGGFIQSQRGRGGMSLARPLQDITLYDVYEATEVIGNDTLFHMHEHPHPNCPVGRAITPALVPHLEDAQRALEEQLKRVTLADIEDEVELYNSRLQ